MAIKKDEFQALIEREGVMDFIWTRTCEDIPNSEICLYHLANDRWGCIFKINPPVYSGYETEKKLSTLFKVQLPNRSSLQLFAFSSRNLSYYKQGYEYLHKNISNIERQDVMKDLSKNKLEWINKYGNESIYSRGIDFRLRNFVNLCAITIPKVNENGIEIPKTEVINIFTRVFSSLTDFSPTKCTQTEYVKVMREILVPDMPLWNPPEDKMNFLNYQVVDNDSVIVLEEETNTIGIGKLISKKEYDKKLKEDINFVETTTSEEEEGILSGLKNMFKKKKSSEKRTAYTNWHAKTYSTKQYPSYMSINKLLDKFTDLFGVQIEPEIPCPFFSSLTLYLEDKEKTKKEVFEKTQWNLWQTTSLGSAVRFFPEIRDRAQESEAINELINDGDIPMTAMWSVVLMDNSLNKVNQYGERLKKKFMENNWIIQEESLIPHWVFLYSLPLQFEPFVLKDCSKRLNTLFSTNCAAISPVMTGSKGIGEPVLLYVDRSGQLAGVDIFTGSSTNFNFIIVGSSGSGKSYTMNDFFCQYLMTGAKIRVIDVGRSYKTLCELVGGQYIEFTEEANIRLNFFTKIAVNQNGGIHEDELQTIVPLVAMMAMQSVSPEDAINIDTAVIAAQISKAVTMAFEAKGRNAGMQDVVTAFENILREGKNETGETEQVLKDLITALYPFANPKGEYFKYFNGPNNLDFRNSDFVIIELEELDSKELLKSVVLASIAHTINNEFFLGERSQPKILVIDEAWSLMDNKNVMRFLETMARRIRKYYGALGIITQTIGDFYKNKATRAIFDSSALKIFLQQSGESLESAQNNGELHFSEGMMHLLKTVKTRPPYYSEVLIKQDSGNFFIGRLITDKVSHWIYTGHHKDTAEIRNIQNKFALSEIEARLLKGYSQKNGTTLEETYINRIENK